MKSNISSIKFYIALFSVFFISCENEPPTNNTGYEPPIVDINDQIINHFIQLTTDGINKLEPRKRRDNPVIYLHHTMSENEKQVVYGFAEQLSVLLGEEIMSFSFTDTMDEYDIAIVYGDAQYLNDNFGTNSVTDNGYWGAAVRTYKECTVFGKTHIWYDVSSSKLIKHEFLHALGLGHASTGRSIMYHNMNDADSNMSDLDKAVLRLLYYNGTYGEIVPPVDNPENCTDDDVFLMGEDLENLKIQLRSILENEFIS